MSHLNTTPLKLTGTVIGAAALTGALFVAAPSTQAATVSLPPTHAGFDYQIGGAYTPPAGVKVVTRDHTASPAAGLYNICYVNAFQAQPGAEGEWASDLLLRDSAGKVVYDEDWGEALLDVGTDAKRRRIADQIGSQIDGCRDKGFQAVEPDNYDSYSRSGNRLTANNAQAFIKLLSARAHADGLAIAQKNTPELAGNRTANGLDFAVAEECGQYDECGDYTSAFGNNVIVIEYTNSGRSKACKGWGGTLSIVQRDVEVSPAGSSGYVRKTC
ncbi:MAG: endo alpha-1,4 polygalactosaminidase [Streptomyces sp.]|uniref:endo alpha-1,4 polygalactosaminidase n=1 Tax=Streptomyces sp. TaxID=1931 RepID=UPI0025F33B69|nr:endo alpha-1,4 polygalactosaminidase [Streptomyces sp.]MBW8794970.1 endo alpha-1,4 polygalactosaminidase [Streptomyces sp.]